MRKTFNPAASICSKDCGDRGSEFRDWEGRES